MQATKIRISICGCLFHNINYTLWKNAKRSIVQGFYFIVRCVQLNKVLRVF